MLPFWMLFYTEIRSARRFTLSLEGIPAGTATLSLNASPLLLFSASQLFAFLVQTSPFAFNNFQDAPPATLSFSWFCIVAGGWVGDPTFKPSICKPSNILRLL